jgi:hypothetical protein
VGIAPNTFISVWTALCPAELRLGVCERVLRNPGSAFANLSAENSASVRAWPLSDKAVLRKTLTPFTDPSQPLIAVTTCSQRLGLAVLAQSLTAFGTSLALRGAAMELVAMVRPAARRDAFILEVILN